MNAANRLPTMAAKLKPNVAAAAVDTVVGLDPVAEFISLILLGLPDVLKPETEELEADTVVLGTEELLTTAGLMVALYREQFALAASAQVSSMQMLWSIIPWDGTTVAGGAQRTLKRPFKAIPTTIRSDSATPKDAADMAT
jgi:hypothetical protein